MNLSDDDNVDPQEEAPTSTGGEAKFAAVEVKSGEEQYNVLLSLTKCEVKILENKNNSKIHTLLVRREVIGKIGAQHQIVAGMKCQATPKSDKVVIWSTAADF